jgi:hypothetical protein
MTGIRWSRRTGYIAMTITVGAALALLLLVLTSAFDTGAGPFTTALLLIVGLVASVSTIVATKDTPLEARHHSAWLQPRPIAFLFVAIFIGFAAMTDVLSLTGRRSAQESEPGAIQSAADRTEGKVDWIASTIRPPETARVRKKIVGLWGESDCRITFRFAVKHEALIITGERAPPGAKRYGSVSTITRTQGDDMDVRGENFRAATFHYWTNGVSEQLTWDDDRETPPSKYRRCEAAPS